jgi:hypothetical protein
MPFRDVLTHQQGGCMEWYGVVCLVVMGLISWVCPANAKAVSTQRVSTDFSEYTKDCQRRWDMCMDEMLRRAQ